MNEEIETYEKQLLSELNDFEDYFVNYLNGATNRQIYRKSVNRLFSEIIRRYNRRGRLLYD